MLDAEDFCDSMARACGATLVVFQSLDDGDLGVGAIAWGVLKLGND